MRSYNDGGLENANSVFRTYSRVKASGVKILAQYIVKYNSNFDYEAMEGYNFTDHALCHLIPETGNGWLLNGTTEGAGCDIDNLTGPNQTSFMPLGFIANGPGVWAFSEKQGDADWNESYEDVNANYQAQIFPMLYSPDFDPEFGGDWNEPSHILFNQKAVDYDLQLYKDNRLSGSSYKAEQGVLMEYHYFKILVPGDIDVETVSLNVAKIETTNYNNTDPLLHCVTWEDETDERTDGLKDFNDFLDDDGILNKGQICADVVEFSDIDTNGDGKTLKLGLGITNSNSDRYINIMVGLRPSLLRGSELFEDTDRSEIEDYDDKRKFGNYITEEFTGFDSYDFLKTKLQNSQTELNYDISMTYKSMSFSWNDPTTEEPTFLISMGYNDTPRPNVIQSAGVSFPVFIGPGTNRPGNLWRSYPIGAVAQYYYDLQGPDDINGGILNPRMGIRTQRETDNTLSWSTLCYESINDESRGHCKYFTILKVASILKSDWTDDIKLRLPRVAGCISNDFHCFEKTTISTDSVTKYKDGWCTKSTAFEEDEIGLYRLDSDDLPALNSEGLTVNADGYGTGPTSDDMDPTLYPDANLSSRWLDNWTLTHTFNMSDLAEVVSYDQPQIEWDFNFPSSGDPTPLAGTTGEDLEGTITKPGIGQEGKVLTLTPSEGSGSGDYANFYLCFTAVEDIYTREDTPEAPIPPAGRKWEFGVPDFQDVDNRTNYVYFCPSGTYSALCSNKGSSPTQNFITNQNAGNLNYATSYAYYPATFQ